MQKGRMMKVNTRKILFFAYLFFLSFFFLTFFPADAQAGISSIDPSIIYSIDEHVSITVLGSDFVDGAVVSVENSGKHISALTTTFMSGGELLAEFSLVEAFRGVWDVVVTLPDQTVFRLTDGLTIDIEHTGHFIQTKDTGFFETTYTTFNWTDNIPIGSSLIMEIRAGNSPVPDGSWSLWETASKGQLIGHLSDNRFFQYRASFSTTDINIIPSLLSVEIGYINHDFLISSPFNSTAADNLIDSLLWSGDTPGTSTILFQLRSSEQNGTGWGEWIGPDGTETSYFASSGGLDAVPVSLRDGSGEQWIQYKVFLVSDGTNSPKLTEVNLFYEATFPSITSLDPQNIEAVNESVLVTITGVDFIEGAYGRLRFKDSGHVVTSSNVTYISSTQIVAEFDLSKSFGGEWDVLVINPSGATGVIPNGLFINNVGVFTSVRDFGQRAMFSTFNWTDDVPVGTSLTMAVRAGNVPSPDESWSSWQSVTKGELISFLDGNRYVQYRATFNSNDIQVVPVLYDVLINYDYYPSIDHLTSSPYNTTDPENIVAKIEWQDVSPVGTNTKFQVRTSPDNLVWTSWMGPDGTSESFFEDSGGAEAMPVEVADATNDQWMQYRAYLESDGMNTPVLEAVTMTYVVNDPPEFNIDYPYLGAGGSAAGQGSDTHVSISYSVRDPDTSEGTHTPGHVTPSFEYSLDAGLTWLAIPPAYLEPSDVLNKAVGGVEFSTYGATWNAKAHIPGEYSNNASVRVTVNDNEAANNIARSSTDLFTLDTKNPEVGVPTGGGVGINVNQNVETSLGIRKTNTQDVTLYLEASDNSPFEMIVSEDPAFTGAFWEGYVPVYAYTLSAGDGDKTVYVRFRDSFGNETVNYSASIILDMTPPAIPADVYIQDISNHTAGKFRMFVNWSQNSEADFIKYDLYRSVGGGVFNLFMTISDIQLNYIIDEGLTEGVSYAYYLVTEDDIGNRSSISETVAMIAGGEVIDPTPPIITVGPSVVDLAATSASVTWTTNEVSTATVFYSTNSEIPEGSLSSGATGYNLSHDVLITGLAHSTTYYFYVESCNASEFCVQSSVSSLTTEFKDTVAPVISNIQVLNINHNSASISWNTDKNSTSFVEYSLSPGFSTGEVVGSFDLVMSHLVNVSGLDSETAYYFKVISTDSAGNGSASAEVSFVTGADPADTTPPILSFIDAVDIGYNTAKVVWTTDEPATSFVQFGETLLYGRTAGSYELVTDHFVELPKDLSANTLYNYRIRSTDASGNEAVSANYTFTTAQDPQDTSAPIISGVVIGTPLESSVNITWQTNEDATSYVEYSAGSLSYNLSQGTAGMTMSHSVTLVGLTPGTLYYFRVRSEDPSGNVARDDNVGNGYSFVTDEVISNPPLISGVTVTGIGSNTATISWLTDKLADSFVEFGFSTSYGRVVGIYSLASSHSISLPEDLIPNTMYHFRVRSTDSDGNLATSEDYTFTTNELEGDPPIDPDPPVISNVHVSLVGQNGATIEWSTNKPATSQVEWGGTTLLGTLTEETTAMTTSHSVTIVGLSLDSDYYYKVISRDDIDNVTVNDNSGALYSFTTLSDEAETIIITQPGQTIDRTAPLISDISVSDIAERTAKITWITSKPTDSFVRYYKEGGEEKIAGSLGLTASHEVVLIELSPGTTYSFQVFGKDNNGNLGQSEYLNFITTGTPLADLDDEDLALEIIRSSPLSLLQKLFDAFFNNPLLEELGEEEFVAAVGDLSSRIIEPPMISGASISVEVESRRAVIKWTTDKEANSLVSFAPADLYAPQSTDPYTLTVGFPDARTTSHEVVLAGLDPGSIYHFQVRSQGRLGQESSSVNATFTTLSETASIENLQFVAIGETSADLKWDTDLPTRSVLTVTETQTGQELQFTFPSYLRSHEYTVTDLYPGVSYNLQVQAEDERGIVSLSAVLPFSTTLSNEPPIISQVRVTSSLIPGKIERVQTIIVWKTDKPSTSRVLYEQGFGGSDTFAFSTPLETNLTTEHTVITTAFSPGNVYRYRVESVDGMGNTAYSHDYTLLSPVPRESVLELIVKNFEQIFGYLRR
jgi:hypothetical protein